MNRKIKNASLIFILLQLLHFGCTEKKQLGPLIGEIDKTSLNLVVSISKVQSGLNALLTPSGNNFRVKNVEIREYNGTKFLRITGTEFQKCMIALKEYNGKLYELNDQEMPIIICSGCNEGCEPRFGEKGWFCTDGCSNCVKSSSVSDNYIFK